MSIIKDVLDIFREVDGTKFEDALNSTRHTSLSKSSANGTLQFPVLCSRSMDLETMMMVSKALERNFASFAQIVFSQNPVFKITGSQNLQSYINKFHQNSDVTTNITDISNSISPIVREGTMVVDGVEIDVKMMAIAYEGFNGRVEADNKKNLDSIMDYFRMDVLNEKYTPRIETCLFKDMNKAAYYNNILTEGKKNSGNTIINNHGSTQDRNMTTNNNGPINQSKNSFYHDESQTSQAINSQTNFDKYSNITGNNIEKQTTNYTTNIGTPASGKSGVEITLPKNILRDNDVKKSNELVPTIMNLKVVMMDKDGKMNGTYEFAVGIKAHLHPIDSEEMVKNLVSACKNNNKVFDFIRWTTGEISFLKDFVFGIDEMKDDVVSRSQGASPWWTILKRRKAFSKIKNKMLLGNNLLPNSSIVITSDEVEFIRTEYGYDLMEFRLMKKIMETYFLISFVIIDSSTEVAHILFDGQQTIQSITFDGLKRENASSKNVDSKEIIKLLNKM